MERLSVVSAKRLARERIAHVEHDVGAVRAQLADRRAACPADHLQRAAVCTVASEPAAAGLMPGQVAVMIQCLQRWLHAFKATVDHGALTVCSYRAPDGARVRGAAGRWLLSGLPWNSE